jgi:glutamate-1-semialdehyde 2,1-aminomutase
MWGFFFSETPVYDFAGSSACDHVAWERFVRSMIADGVYLAPSPFEAAFWSAAHGEAEVAHTLAAAERAFLTLS